jgi:RNA polymerase sigma factor (sigma-70 family)
VNSRMPDGESTFADLMRRVREGSQEALFELVRDYEHHILHAVRRRLSRRMRSKFDSRDFQQAVWASFFAHGSRVGKFSTPEQLVAFLAGMARHKVITEFRRRLVGMKHNINLERPIDAVPAEVLVADQPTPSEVLIADEQLMKLLHNRPMHYRQMIVLRHQGYSHKEIAERVGVDEKTVRRVFYKLATEDST